MKNNKFFLDEQYTVGSKIFINPLLSILWSGFRKVNVFLLLILLLAIIVHCKWISFGVFQYGDWRFHLAEVGKAFLDVTPWDTNFNFGQLNLTLWKLPYNVIYGLFASFGFNSNVTEKFLILWPAILLPPLASFFLVRQVACSNAAAFSGALVYSFNSYFFSINTVGHQFLTVAAAFGVMAIWLFMRALELKSFCFYLIAGLAGCFSIIYDIRMAYLVVFINAIYWLYFVYSSENKIIALRSTVVKIGILICILALLNSYWLLPVIADVSLLKNEILRRELFGNEFFNILRAIALFHPFWNGSKPEWFMVQPIPLYFYIIPTFSFLGLLLNIKNKDVLFFGLISVCGVFLAKQVGVPFSQIYSFLFKEMPGFGAFREASKFYFLVAIGYAVLIGALVSWLQQNILYKYTSLLSHAILLVVLSVFMLNAKPMITGKIETMFVERHIPEDYIRLKQYILQDQEFSRVLWIPQDIPWEVNNSIHPSLSMAKLISEIRDRYFYPETGSNITIGGRMLSFFEDDSSAPSFLVDYSIKYIVVPLRDTKNDGDFYHYYGLLKNSYINYLDKLRYLRRLNIGMNDTILYENTNYHLHIYVTHEIESAYKKENYNINYNSKKNSKFIISLKKIPSPIYLNFTDNYHPNWILCFSFCSWWDVLFGNYIKLQKDKHFVSDTGTNKFYIDPSYIVRNYPKNVYMENEDGSIDIELILYFKPQAYLNFGIMISSLTFIAIFFYLAIIFFKRIKIWPRKFGQPDKW